MELKVWMRRNDYTADSFRKQIETLTGEELSVKAVYNWSQGITLPRGSKIDAIKTLTGGQVTYDDHAAKHREYQDAKQERADAKAD